LILGVTGSNGKTTTTLLAAHLLQTAGLKALAVGNVGIPLITQLERDADAYVVELSSFQLEGILERGILDGAVILNLTPNHLDRHPSFEDYCQAKKRIASCLKEKAPLYVSQQVADLGINGVIFDSWKEKVETILPLSYRDNLYPHDLENFAAAFALTSVSEETLRLGIKTFIRPPHRLESVRNVSGVLYMNDSKATSVDAVIKAVGALKGPILLIAGGVDKGGNFSDWLPYFKGKVARVFALGAAAGRIAKELSPEIDVEQVSNLEEGIMQASKRASAGYTVLLSPGCSSYDQFRDYQHRGEMFRQIVEEKL
jgi:UDP-N-acetylmuramoylalanine--D-glutamate ligase